MRHIWGWIQCLYVGQHIFLEKGVYKQLQHVQTNEFVEGGGVGSTWLMNICLKAVEKDTLSFFDWFYFSGQRLPNRHYRLDFWPYDTESATSLLFSSLLQLHIRLHAHRSGTIDVVWPLRYRTLSSASTADCLCDCRLLITACVLYFLDVAYLL